MHPERSLGLRLQYAEERFERAMPTCCSPSFRLYLRWCLREQKCTLCTYRQYDIDDGDAREDFAKKRSTDPTANRAQLQHMCIYMTEPLGSWDWSKSTNSPTSAHVMAMAQPDCMQSMRIDCTLAAFDLKMLTCPWLRLDKCRIRIRTRVHNTKHLDPGS